MATRTTARSSTDRRRATQDTDSKAVVDKLLADSGQTYADEAGIRLRDKPASLYQLLVLAVLASAPIRSATAVDAAHELTESKMGTPRAMRQASRRDRIQALGRAHYVRYDESTATALGRGADLLLDRYGGDLRRLLDAADHQPERVAELLREFPRLGPVGADVFCREAQQVWPDLQPYFDDKTLAGAKRVGLPADADRLAALVEPEDYARLAAALVRADLEHRRSRRSKS
ncbi:endonuclease [Actinoalloteichus hymeniacidonis]|uniref:Endonuclease n=1 Tax=Actinoalloteichus hymeniacidonis TaxID=340345 RepID=A0AAC9MWE7_9PSEU|nr:endonuclease [Actinoalloteichus hymeniacidonis]AOS60976.1 hypothetical protein TL08_00640 [Actinoalloteichus hymeniacidonis]MBB5911024.1 hypothetical protein [Actinoalloteichus hymeniacidonis]